jgi:hypothetical protein
MPTYSGYPLAIRVPRPEVGATRTYLDEKQSFRGFQAGVLRDRDPKNLQEFE